MEDKRIELKKELVAKAKELAEKVENSDVAIEFANLKKRWRKTLREEESFAEKELSDEFDKIVAEINKKVGDLSVSVEDRKKQIIEEAKKALDSESIKNANKKMEELVEAWKQAGHTTKEKDDELWEEFKGLRNDFYKKRNEYFANLKETFAKNKEEKEKIIEEAIKANEGTNFKEIGAKMAELEEAWKKVGHAGRNFENELWEKFKAERKAFYKNRKAYLNSMKETFAQRAEAKKELIAEAKLYLARSEFNEEEIEAVKNLRTKWKEIGNSGRDNEDTLWEEFNTLINKYYENMRIYKK
ncbi:MAG: DUF349 domain-containing protein [Erysipelotrichaceae bacterium]|nr:DUF349 domain-containing protein [Erysipelotrichaceae bacterium]